MKLETILIIFAALIIGTTAGHYHGVASILREYTNFTALQMEKLK